MNPPTEPRFYLLYRDHRGVRTYGGGGGFELTDPHEAVRFNLNEASVALCCLIAQRAFRSMVRTGRVNPDGEEIGVARAIEECVAWRARRN